MAVKSGELTVRDDPGRDFPARIVIPAPAQLSSGLFFFDRLDRILQPRHKGLRLRSAARRIMSATFADGREAGERPVS